jgi:membrane associated rhomboid family serine protease
MSVENTSAEGDQTPQNSNVTPVFPVPIYTYVLVGSILIVFIVQCLTGDALSSAIVGDERSILLAGFDKQRFLHAREYWRILTGACIHGGILHILFNSIAFYNLGGIFEFLANRAHLAIVFLLSVIGGNLLSLAFLPGVTSIGASGGIVGLLGYLTIYAFRRRQFISPEFRSSLLKNIVFLLVFGLALYHVVDNFGHIGGLITGAVYAVLQIPSDPNADPRDASAFAGMAGIASLGIYIAACCFSILLILRFV